MWCSSGEASSQNGQQARSWCSDAGRKGKWRGLNLVVMILGFVFFWPVGLAIVFWIGSGRSVHEIPAAARELWDHFFESQAETKSGASGNRVFNDFQQTQYDRISEIKEEIKSRAKRFSDFRGNAQRRADEEEFKRFMDDVPSSADKPS